MRIGTTGTTQIGLDNETKETNTYYYSNLTSYPYDYNLTFYIIVLTSLMCHHKSYPGTIID
jgi:hypothetical protein